MSRMSRMGEIGCTGGDGVRCACVCLTRRKGLEDLNVYRNRRGKKEKKVRKDLNGCIRVLGCRPFGEGQALALRN